MNQTRSVGGIVLGDAGTIALVKSTNSQSWLFPKGRLEEGETDEEAARREIVEETGLTNLELIGELGEFTRMKAGSDEEMKSIKMFLFAAPMHAKLIPTLEIEEAKWVPFQEVSALLGTPHTEWFAADRAWFASVYERVREAIQRD